MAAADVMPPQYAGAGLDARMPGTWIAGCEGSRTLWSPSQLPPPPLDPAPDYDELPEMVPAAPSHHPCWQYSGDPFDAKDGYDGAAREIALLVEALTRVLHVVQAQFAQDRRWIHLEKQRMVRQPGDEVAIPTRTAPLCARKSNPKMLDPIESFILDEEAAQAATSAGKLMGGEAPGREALPMTEQEEERPGAEGKKAASSDAMKLAAAEAVKQNGGALTYCSETLRSDKDVAMEAMHQPLVNFQNFPGYVQSKWSAGAGADPFARADPFAAPGNASQRHLEAEVPLDDEGWENFSFPAKDEFFVGEDEHPLGQLPVMEKVADASDAKEAAGENQHDLETRNAEAAKRFLQRLGTRPDQEEASGAEQNPPPPPKRLTPAVGPVNPEPSTASTSGPSPASASPATASPPPPPKAMSRLKSPAAGGPASLRVARPVPTGAKGMPLDISQVKRCLEGIWKGCNGESYEFFFFENNWQCQRIDNQGTRRFQVRYDEGSKVVKWGEKYYLDPSDFQLQPRSAHWYFADDVKKYRARFVWTRKNS